MPSEVNICNLALSRVGAYRIAALTADTKEARECNLHYPHARDTVLRDHDWAFARKRLVLALSSSTYTEWTYAYAYPSDCLSIRRIIDETGEYTGTSYDVDSERYLAAGRVEFEIAAADDLNQRLILTDKASAELVYTAAVTNVNMFDLLFVDAVAWKLAAELALTLRNDKNLHQLLFNEYTIALSRAKTGSANEDYKKDDDRGEMLRARD